ncbi:uncharacterized protein LOC109594131 [Aethina tumida]|uniref:uncharacterized protein LOC109594131 n=1 Tax=Aethina tumida TaxID=116153 RepID=UPI002148EFF4|nr:uncharacterized protein LOC109594131 [Aethina tumida]
MDEKLNEIINKNDEWIITKNEGGKLQVAACRDSEIFDETQKASREYVEFGSAVATTSSAIRPAPTFSFARFFIIDLLNSEIVENHFKFNDLRFRSVEIYGLITSMYNHNNKKCLIVDDGTASIVCMIDEKYNETEILDKQDEIDELYKKLNSDSSDVLIKAAIMMQKHHKKIKDKQEVAEGDYVKLVGNLSHFNDSRYIFINKLEREDDPLGPSTNLKNMLHLYENVYNKSE